MVRVCSYTTWSTNHKSITLLTVSLLILEATGRLCYSCTRFIGNTVVLLLRPSFEVKTNISMDRFTRDYLIPLIAHLVKDLGQDVSNERIEASVRRFNNPPWQMEEPSEASELVPVAVKPQKEKPKIRKETQKRLWYIPDELTVVLDYSNDSHLLIGMQTFPLFKRGFFVKINGDRKFLSFSKTAFGRVWCVNDKARLVELTEALEKEGVKCRTVTCTAYRNENRKAVRAMVADPVVVPKQ